MLQGLMMQMPLLISSLIEHADRDLATRRSSRVAVEGDHPRLIRIANRIARAALANALGRARHRPSERVATLAWNGYRHMELYFAVSGAGSVYHTINRRLPGADRMDRQPCGRSSAFFDLTFLPLIEAVAPVCKTVKHWVVMTDRAHMPAEIRQSRPAVL